MELKVKSEILAGLVTKAQKAAKINPHFALTTYLQIESDGKKLSVRMFDGMNYFLFSHDIVLSESKFVVKAESFFKLMAKTTSKEICLKDEDNFISFKGNGVYKLDKEFDRSTEENISIVFPEIKIEKKSKLKIKTEEFKSITKMVLPGVAETQGTICLTGVFASKDEFMACDQKRAIKVDSGMFKDDVLLSVELVNLINLIDEKEINFAAVKVDDACYYVIESSNAYIIGQQLLGIEQYPTAPINGIFEKAEGSTAEVAKADLLSAIERFLVFTERIDIAGVEIAITKDSLILRKENIGEEVLDIKNVKDFKPYSCKTDLIILKKLIESATEDKLTFVFGNAKFIIFTYGKTKLLLSTVSEAK